MVFLIKLKCFTHPFFNMYEELIAFLLGKKDEFTDEDLNEFMNLLVEALDLIPEYEILEKQTLVENMMNKAKVNSEADRVIIGNKLNGILRIEHVDGLTTRKRPTRVAKLIDSNKKLFNSRKPFNERISSTSENIKILKTNNNKIVNNSKKETKQNSTDLDKLNDDNNKIINIFSDNFSKKKLDSSVEKILNEANIVNIDKNTKKISDKSNETFNFEINIDQLEENQNTGPDFHFDLE